MLKSSASCIQGCSSLILCFFAGGGDVSAGSPQKEATSGNRGSAGRQGELAVVTGSIGLVLPPDTTVVGTATDGAFSVGGENERFGRGARIGDPAIITSTIQHTINHCIACQFYHHRRGEKTVG